MPSHSGPNTFGEDSLIFGYDLLDRANSYKNPPAINLVHANVARGSTSNWEGYGVHTGYGLVNNGNGIKDGRSDVVSVTWKGDATRTGDWYPRFNLRNPDGSYVTTEGGEVFYAAWEYKYEGEEYLVSGVPDFTTENFYGNGWKSGVHGSITTLYTQDLPLGWKRRVARIVAGDSGSTQTPVYRFGSGYKQASDGNFTLWLDNISITRDYPVHSWFPGQSEISFSESLKDITGTATINLSNISFDDKGSMTFDGTDDRIVLPADSFPKIGTNDFTLEFVCKNTRTSRYNHFFAVNDQYHFAFKSSNTSGILYLYRTSDLSTTSSIPAYIPSRTDYYHIVATRNGDNIEIYINGVSQGVKSGWGDVSIDNDLYTSYIGWGVGTEYTGGDIPLAKIYSKALTPEEINHNFNLVKSRHNI